MLSNSLENRLSLVVKKPDFCICENKDAADQRLCFSYIDSTISLLLQSEIFKPLAIFCGCTSRFLSDLVRNPEDRFSNDESHICLFVNPLRKALMPG